MITTEELKDIPIFTCTTDAMRQRVAQNAADVKVCPGEWVIREGEVASFFVVLTGSLDIVKDYNGRELVVNQYSAGDFFGETPILLTSPMIASLRARSESRLLRMDKLLFKELIDSSEECSKLVMQTMLQRVTKIQNYVKDAEASRVLVVGSQYDTDCREIRTFLSMNRIPYEWVDREREPERIPSCMPPDHEGPSVVVDQSFCLGAAPTVRSVAEALGFKTEPRDNAYDVVIVGGGPAGLAAAVYGASEGLKTLLVEKNAAGGQAGTSSRIENYLGFPSGISGDELTERAVKQAQHFDAEIVLTREVKNIARVDGHYCVEFDGGQRVNTRTVVLATGVAWRRLEAAGVDRLIGRGVLYGAARTEAMTVIGKDVFIVGGGNSAGQAAMYFSSYARSVTVLVRGAGLAVSMSQYLITQIDGRPNIRIEPYTEVISVGGHDHLQSICTSERGQAPVERPADALFVMIGADASTDWLPGELQRDQRGYICTGRDVEELPDWRGDRAPFLLETNLPGIFCAGDVRHDSIKRVSSGVGEGSMAIAFIHQYLALQTPQPLAAA